MWIFALKTVGAALVTAFSAWLAGKKPQLAGFIVALPMVSIIALLFSYLEHRDSYASITFAKSIMIGVPVSWLFFLPFFLAERLNYGFWLSYVLGLMLLVLGFFIHTAITRSL